MKLLKILMLLLYIAAASIDLYMVLFYPGAINSENFIEPVVLTACLAYLYWPAKADNGEKALVCAVFLMELLLVNGTFTWQRIAFAVMAVLVLVRYLPQVKLGRKMRMLFTALNVIAFIPLILYYTYTALPMYFAKFMGYDFWELFF